MFVFWHEFGVVFYWYRFDMVVKIVWLVRSYIGVVSVWPRRDAFFFISIAYTDVTELANVGTLLITLSKYQGQQKSKSKIKGSKTMHRYLSLISNTLYSYSLLLTFTLNEVTLLLTLKRDFSKLSLLKFEFWLTEFKGFEDSISVTNKTQMFET